MICGRCENEHDGAPWMLFDGKNLEAYCPDCAIAELEAKRARVIEAARRARDN